MGNGLNVITGGKGYVGFALVKELAARGEKMRLLLRTDSPYFDDIDCEKFMGDVTDLSQLEKAFEGAETVYHVAGIVDISGTKDKQVWNVNYEGTKNVVEACKKCGVKTLIYCSSVDAIAINDDFNIIREAKSFNPDLLEGAYAKSKAAATQYVLDNADENLKICVVHPSCCIGPYDNNNTSSVGTMLSLYLKGLFPVTMNFGGYNFVDVRDVAKGMVLAAEKGENANCYILSGYAHTLDEFIKTLALVCGKKPPKIKLKKNMIMKLLPEIERIFDALKLPPLLNEYSIRKLCENCNFSCFKAKTELGYNPMTLEESLRDTVEWMQARKIDEKEREAQEEIYKEFMEDLEKLEKERQKLQKEQESLQEKYNKKIEKIGEKSKKEYIKLKKD
ncbi:MAG: NAD-dependent epimerase/dehydratase family protein [Acutalibacteraceae bacterium]|nr:NAD-dependent epimerase/dehydratase family protein [Acutalibacteraceae bacterium]